MAKKGPMPSFETIDDYIAHQPEDAREKLNELRAIIKEAAPDAKEVLNYKIPCFTLVSEGKRDQQIMMAGYARFIGFYPFPTTMEAFAEELKGFKKGKGSVQFPLNQPLPKELIRRMVKFRKDELQRDN
ncbi:iron chaperone [Halocola ammonii]